MSKYLKKRVESHKVKHISSNKRHMYEVTTKEGKKHIVFLQASCNCEFSSIQGIPNGKACGCIIAMFKHNYEKLDYK